jgi:cation:H+ antiporter
MTAVMFAIGLAALISGAELLVRGASNMAQAMRISPLLIGLTVVAFGTSSPELAVSVDSTLAGQQGIALGNVLGSNIFNVLFILGISALIIPIAVSSRIVRLDVPLMLGVSVLLMILSLDGTLDRTDGILLVLGLAAYLLLLFLQSRREHRKSSDREEPVGSRRSRTGIIMNPAMIIAGLALLIMGSRKLVESSVTIADYLGVSDLVVGLTIVAAGTSLPELVTSLVAAIRGERDIAVGNVVGSNVFNILGVLGISSIAAPVGIPVSEAVLGFDMPVMIAASLACLPIFFTGGKISRTEGILLLGYYVAYAAYLVMAASHHDALPVFSAAMLCFVIPLTAVTMIVIAARQVLGRGNVRSM